MRNCRTPSSAWSLPHTGHNTPSSKIRSGAKHQSNNGSSSSPSTGKCPSMIKSLASFVSGRSKKFNKWRHETVDRYFSRSRSVGEKTPATPGSDNCSKFSTSESDPDDRIVIRRNTSFTLLSPPPTSRIPLPATQGSDTGPEETANATSPPDAPGTAASSVYSRAVDCEPPSIAQKASFRIEIPLTDDEWKDFGKRFAASH